jgi:hypothetical protein
VPRFVYSSYPPVSSLTLANEPLVAGRRRYPPRRFIFSSSAVPTALFRAVFLIFVETHVRIAKSCQVHHSQGSSGFRKPHYNPVKELSCWVARAFLKFKSQILSYHLPGKALGSSLKFCSCQVHGLQRFFWPYCAVTSPGVRWGRNAAPPRGCLFAATYHKIGFTE